MNALVLNNIQWIIGSGVALIVWLIRLEGVVKQNKQATEAAILSQILQIQTEFKNRDLKIDVLKDEVAHITRMGENIKDTLSPLLQKVAALDAKMDIVLEKLSK